MRVGFSAVWLRGQERLPGSLGLFDIACLLKRESILSLTCRGGRGLAKTNGSAQGRHE
jgi:hypothetical protein